MRANKLLITELLTIDNQVLTTGLLLLHFQLETIDLAHHHLLADADS